MKKKKLSVEELARFMHDEYEKTAKMFKWDTQKITRVDFNDLPIANKLTMYVVANEVIKWFEKNLITKP